MHLILRLGNAAGIRAEVKLNVSIQADNFTDIASPMGLTQDRESIAFRVETML